MTYKKKLIEVALPLEAINKASVREKSIRHGHPSTLHLWWARRPLATARAVIFAHYIHEPTENSKISMTQSLLEPITRTKLKNQIEKLLHLTKSQFNGILPLLP